MKFVVIGGSGLIGSQVVAQLLESGHEAVSASPRSGVDTLTGEGVTEALNGAHTVIDVSNSPSWADDDVLHFFTGTLRRDMSLDDVFLVLLMARGAMERTHGTAARASAASRALNLALDGLVPPSARTAPAPVTT